VVQRGKAQDLVVKLEPETDIEEVLVEAKVQKRNEAALLQVRKKAVAVSDVISAQEISKTPDSNAGDAVKRVVAITLVDGKYVVVRGLEGRYVQTLLNGVVLPSLEPDRNAVPLDIFPTALLANLTVIKSYASELPGQFGGGALLIETNSYPEDFELKVSASTSGNTSDTFEDGLGNAGGSTAGNFFGFDDGSRDLPDPVPTNAPVRNLDNAYTEQIGEAFPNVWDTPAESVRPNFSLGFTAGDTRKLGGSRKLGYLTSGQFRKGFDVRTTDLQYLQLSEDNPNGFQVQSTQRNVTGESETSLAGLANVGLELDSKNTINLLGLYTHIGEDGTGRSTGVFNYGEFESDRYRLQFVERSLLFGQLGGEHRLSNALEVTWQGHAATTTRDELDSRDVDYRASEGQPFQYDDQPGSGQRFFSFLDDSVLGLGADAAYEKDRLKLRGGAFASRSSRQLDSRRFRFRKLGSPSVETLGLPPEQMFSPEHIGTSFYVVEETTREDAYTAGLDVMGGFASGELELSESFRAIAGLRYEHARQSMRNDSPYATTGMAFDVEYPSDDFFPTANLIYAATPNMNLRAAYSYTVVRPRFRELAPFSFYDYVRDRSVSGNPELLDTGIHNGDLRWEWFPGEAEVLAASAFYKQFSNPIELVTANANNDAYFDNAQGATLYGVELEARIALRSDFKVGANLALMKSEIELSPDDTLSTNKKRPLYGQSPYLVNVFAGYAHARHGELALLYNVIGDSISDVGVLGSPDIYNRYQHKVDLSASRKLNKQLKLKGSVTNLLNQKAQLVQADHVVADYSPGVSLSLGLEWSP
jgi:outer membrane receptor protein involved in Fe transport